MNSSSILYQGDCLVEMDKIADKSLDSKKGQSDIKYPVRIALPLVSLPLCLKSPRLLNLPFHIIGLYVACFL